MNLSLLQQSQENRTRNAKQDTRPNTEMSSHLVVTCRHQIRKEKYQDERKMETPPLYETLVVEEATIESEKERELLR